MQDMRQETRADLNGVCASGEAFSKQFAKQHVPTLTP
jgi:hypothetical protein